MVNMISLDYMMAVGKAISIHDISMADPGYGEDPFVSPDLNDF